MHADDLLVLISHHTPVLLEGDGIDGDGREVLPIRQHARVVQEVVQLQREVLGRAR